MEQAERMIEMYQNIAKACGGFAGIGWAVVFVLCICWHIPVLADKVSGRAAKRAVKKLLLLLFCCWQLGTALEVQAATVPEGETEEEDIPEDTVEPEACLVWKDEQGELLQNYYQTGDELYVELQIQEQNLDKESTCLELKAQNVLGQKLECEEGRLLCRKSWAELERLWENRTEEETLPFALQQENETYIFSMTLQSEAVYCLTAVVRDQTGNEKRIQGESYCLDRTKPSIEVKYDAEGKPVGDVTWEAEQQSFLQKWIHGMTFGYFCKPVLKVRIQAWDAISGVEAITYICEGIEGEEAEEVCTETTVLKDQGVEQEKERPVFYVMFELPQTFQGRIRARAKDCAGHEMAEFAETVNLWAESEQTHETYASARLLSVEGTGKKEGFYCGDVRFTFEMEDTFTGMQEITFEAGSQREMLSFEEEAEPVPGWVGTFTVWASEQQRNSIPVKAGFRDPAGYETVVQGLPEIHIDTQAPVVEIQWDNWDVRNERYYRADRTAKIFVTEKNFDPADVQLKLEGKAAPLLSWNHLPGEGCAGSRQPEDVSHADTCIWKTEIRFAEDGEYRLGFACVDAAGNSGSWGKTEEFVIDKTPPVLQMFWNPAEGEKQKYYRQARKGTVQVTEEHFDPKDGTVQIRMWEQEKALEPIAAGSFQNWEKAVWRAGVALEQDGIFQLRAECRDLAGNEAEVYESEVFVVDRTKPQVLFENIVDYSANMGVVEPQVSVTDANYAQEQVVIELTGCNGTGQIPDCRVERKVRGNTWKWENFAYRKENDDLYRLSVKARDMAGNVTEESLQFSVNRFGSFYVVEEETQGLAGRNGKYYTRQAPELILTEYNVDFLQEREVVCNREGELKTLQEGVDYQVEMAGDEKSWKQYRYRIGAANFRKEGTYVVTVSSVDRAGNRSANHMKGAMLTFAVDKAAPDVLLSGMEDGGRYRMNRKELQVEIQDSFKLQKAEIYINGEKTAVYEEEILQNNQGRFHYEVLGAPDWQTIQVKAWDMSGNVSRSEKLTFLMTERLWIQFWNSPQAVGLALGGILLILTGSGLWVWRRKRNACNQNLI